MQSDQTGICSNSPCVERSNERKRSKDIQATKNDKVRLIIDKSHVQRDHLDF
jgi:hypothetical protein